MVISKVGSILSVNSETALKVGEAYLSDIKKLASLNSYIGVLEIFVDNPQFIDCILFKDNKVLNGREDSSNKEDIIYLFISSKVS